MAHSEYERRLYRCCHKEDFAACQARHTNGLCPFYMPIPALPDAGRPKTDADDLLKFCAAIGMKLTPWQSALLLAWCQGDPS